MRGGQMSINYSKKIENKIIDLINKKHEGSYWDYKACYHENKKNLLLDILCLANNQTFNDGYIIFGISDNGDVVGIENDNNRKTQQNVIDFISSKKFVGGLRPTVEKMELKLVDKIVDVLVVKNDNNTPYVLDENYCGIKKNIIYTRVGDNNTAIDKSADINHIEFLWKKRFGLLPNPLKRFETYLCDKDGWSSKKYDCYYKEHPEFTIAVDDDNDERDRTEFYSYVMDNNRTRFSLIELLYHSTVLYKSQIVWLDSSRYLTNCPEWGHISNKYSYNDSILYKYFIKNTFDYNLHLFLYDETSHEARYARDRFMSVVVLYESCNEKDYFEKYVQNNISEFLVEVDNGCEQEKDFDGENEKHSKHINRKIETAKVLIRMLEEFRIKL